MDSPNRRGAHCQGLRSLQSSRCRHLASVGRKTLEPESAVGLDQFRSYESLRDVLNSADIIFHSPAACTEPTWRVGSGQEGGVSRFYARLGRLVLLGSMVTEVGREAVPRQLSLADKGAVRKAAYISTKKNYMFLVSRRHSSSQLAASPQPAASPASSSSWAQLIASCDTYHQSRRPRSLRAASYAYAVLR